jgi:hypothetical protein
MGAEVNPYLLGAAIYLVLFVVAVLFMFALGRAVAKADRDAERLGRPKGNPVNTGLIADPLADGPSQSARPVPVYGHRVQAVDGKPVHSDWFMADLVARTVLRPPEDRVA